MTIKDIQKFLNDYGYADPLLEVDGNFGIKSIRALNKMQKSFQIPITTTLDDNTFVEIALFLKEPIDKFPPKTGKLHTTKSMKSIFGEPCSTKNRININLPYPMRIAWDLKYSIRSMEVHKDIAERMQKALTEILYYYGLEKIKELGIDLYGGCYNCRQMRNGVSWSIHAWAAALDLDPTRNGLKTPFNKANFSKKEYAPLFWIFYKNGFINLGIEANKDAMHWQTI